MPADNISMSAKLKESPLVFIATPQEFFSEMIDTALKKRQFEFSQSSRIYLIKLLEFYLDSRNFFTKPETLAEAYLLASNSQSPGEKIELLKTLGDRSLYISGFFGDSLMRKSVDIDYYAGMGGAAYAALANYVKEEELSEVFNQLSEQFLDVVEVLNFISQHSSTKTDQGLLKLYDRYLRTGSESAKEKLLEMGVLTLPLDQAKLSKQD